MRGIGIIGGVVALGAIVCWWVWIQTPASLEPSSSQSTEQLTPPMADEPLAIARDDVQTLPSLDGGTVLAVKDWNGNPVAGAQVAVLEADGAAQQYAASDAQGLVSLEAASGGKRLLVVASSYAPVVTEPLAFGQREVILPRSGVVAGRVTFLGQTPTESLTLILEGAVRLVPFGKVRPEVLEAMGVSATRTGRMQVVTDEGGNFQFSGLPPDWSGVLRWESRWHFRSGMKETQAESYLMRLEQPQEGIQLDLDPPLIVTGRIVLSDGVTAIGAGEALLTADLVEHDAQLYGNSQVLPDGRFRIPMKLPPEISITNLILQIRARGAAEFASASFPFDVTSDESLDLGVIVLPDGRTLRLAITDASGRVVADAEARAEWGLDWHGPPDEQGVIRLPIEAHETAVLIKASGHFPARIPIPASGVADPLSVMLESANEVVVRILTAAGQPFADASVSIMGDPTLFAFRDWEHSDWLRRKAGTRWKSARWGAQQEWFFRPDAAGVVRLSGLDPSQSFNLAVFPDGGLAVHLERVEALPAGEVLERVVTIEEDHVLFQGRVVTADGIGICPDKITIATRFREGELVLAEPEADEEGRFSASLCRIGAVSVSIQRKGFPLLRVDPVPIGSTETEHLFTLAASKRVTIHVRTAAGDGVSAEVEIHAAGSMVGSRRCDASGIAILEAIPYEDCSARIIFAGKEYFIALGSFETEARFTVDSVGQLRIQCSAEFEAARAEGLLSLAVRALNADGVEVRQAFPRDGEMFLPLVAGRYNIALLKLDWESFQNVSIREIPQVEITANETTELVL